MTRWCSPCNLLRSAIFSGILWLCNPILTEAQCSGDFTFSVKAPATPDGKGKIELLIDNPAAGTYSFKIYKMEGTLTLVETKTASSPRSISFEGLEPSAYFVKIEWGDGCYRTIGGFDGIIIATTKDRE